MDLVEYFIELHRRESELVANLKNIRNAIQAGQEICDHDYIKIGNTHKDVFECRICKHRMTD